MSTPTYLKEEENKNLRLLQRNFDDITEYELQLEILEKGKILHIPKGKTIMTYGHFIRTIPLVLNGVIKVSRENKDGQELLLHYLKAGSTCSITLICCRIDKKSILKSVAETDVTLIAVPIEAMELWTSKYPSWKNFTMLSYDKYMSQMIDILDAVAFQKVDARLTHYLNEKSSISNSTQIKVSHSQIATDLNTSRETISRILKQMEKEGKLKLGRNRIELNV